VVPYGRKIKKTKLSGMLFAKYGRRRLAILKGDISGLKSKKNRACVKLELVNIR
jgi:hypothetical protein